MTDPNDFLDPAAEPELEPELEHAPDRFFSMATLLRNLPFMVALALAIFGVAYSNFSGHTINGYWEFLAIAMGLVCIATGWPNAPERKTRFHLVWTQRSTAIGSSWRSQWGLCASPLDGPMRLSARRGST